MGSIMSGFVLFLLPLLTVLSAPTAQNSPPDPSSSTSSIIVSWHHNKLLSQVSLNIFSPLTSSLLFRSPCYSFPSTSTTGITLNQFSSPSFIDFPLTIHPDADGFGILTYGNTTYTIHHDPTKSGGIKCTQVYSASTANVECIVPWLGPSLEQQEARSADVDENIDSCTGAPATRGLAYLFSGESEPLLQSAPESASSNFTLGAPLEADLLAGPGGPGGLPGPPMNCAPKVETKLDGNGSPTNWSLHKQVTQNIDCGPIACSATHSIGKTLTVGFTVTGSIYGWISGGFQVQKSVSTTNAYGCNGRPGDRVCIWYQTQHIEYAVKTIRGAVAPICNMPPAGVTSAKITSPRTEQGGKEFYCVVGGCKNEGYAGWRRE